jgi:8-oxo-dGTP pyrophosphatase MutT (NUDIX family)
MSRDSLDATSCHASRMSWPSQRRVGGEADSRRGAVIFDGGLVLCAQRGPAGALAGLWEFPGGPIEAGESPEAALTREIAEELGCGI